MEKVIYVVWRDPATTIDALGQQLRLTLAPQLKSLGVKSLRINVADAAVAAATGIWQKHQTPPVEAIVQVWLDSAITLRRAPVDAAVAAVSARHAAYLVTESVPLPNTLHPARHGLRTEGFAQVALFPHLASISHEQFLQIWQESHTTVAIETQSNFEYVQNRVVRALTPGAPEFHAIIEESFPVGAMTDPQLFFDAAGDQTKFNHNLKLMMDSVARFIDMARIDVAPTSQYLMF